MWRVPSYGADARPKFLKVDSGKTVNRVCTATPHALSHERTDAARIDYHRAPPPPNIKRLHQLSVQPTERPANNHILASTYNFYKTYPLDAIILTN